MKKIKITAFVFAFLIFFAKTNFVFAQKSVIYVHPDADFKTGIELFQKEKFGAAQKNFTKIIESNRSFNSLLRIDAEYYNAICAIELFNRDGELLLKNFVKDYPESPKVKSAYYFLGGYNFRKGKYKDALDWYDKVDIYDLTADELSEFYFKRGYSYFSTDNYNLAKKDLYEIKDIDGKYAAPAKYYFAHIAYHEKNYETALKDFLKLQKNETFGTVVPYYIAQLYYLQKRYDQVIAYAPGLLDTINVKRAPEIAHVLGDAYYQTAQYKEAIPFLKRYEKSAGHLSREDNYQMGFAYYKVKNYEKALDYFIHVTEINEDSLLQNSFYHIGDCYLQLGYKQRAINAFAQAAKLNFDKVIQEDALYSYGKLCYELAYNPFNETIKALQAYITNYPNSVRLDEMYAYLVNVFTTSKNYKDALVAIENIKTLTPELKYAYQKVAYYRGVELFNSGDYNEAIKLFDKALTYKFDKSIIASSIYWKAESYYRIKQYAKAIEFYQDYIDEPGAIGKSEWCEANYNTGYAYYNLKDYTNSNLWFRKFVTFKPQADPKKINDAYNRIGDGYFMARDFENAAEYYEQSYKMKLVGTDYALFQKALAYGVQKKHAQKIADLTVFIHEYPKSTFIQKAKFELAQTYLSDNQTDLALSHFKKFIDEYPNSLYVNTCLSKIALIYYNRKDDNQALAYFDKLIKRDRKSNEATEAINAVKSIYLEKGNVQAMQDYLATVGAAIPQASLDTMAYSIGKNHYMERDCKSVIADFEKYIQKFPDGIFISDANFYKADCEFSSGNVDSALVGYINVVNKPKNQHTEQSLYYASIILHQKQKYEQAIVYFKLLEQQAENPKNNATAKVGLMRCYFQLKNYADAIDYANKVISIDKVSNEITYEAHFTIAQSLMATDKIDDALAEYRSVANSTKNEYGAESSYYIANIQYLKGNYKQSEKIIFSFVNGDGDFPYWVTKSLILLSDNYVAMKDNFQAKTTLNSIISDSDIPELIKLAQEKLDKITADELAAKKVEIIQEPLKLRFEGDTIEQKKLFNEPPSAPKGELEK
jgi:tetratricopeptide (TPR) repeat protein